MKAQNSPHESPPADAAPQLINTCLITPNVNQQVAFYEAVLKLKAERSGEDYAEFHTGAGVLAIFSAASQERYIPGSAVGAANKSVVFLNSKPADVDREYADCMCEDLGQTPDHPAVGTADDYFRDPTAIR